MSIDSIIYLAVAVTIFSGMLGAGGFLFHDDKDDPGVLGLSLVSAAVAVFWPIILALGVLSSPYWAGRALAAHRKTRAKRRALARQDTLDSLVFLLGELDEASVAHQVVKEQLAELGKNR